MQENGEDQKRNTWRAWLRWVVACVVGGVVSSGGAYGATYYLVDYVIQPPNSIPGAFTSLGLHFLTTFIGGLLGSFLHWLIVERPHMGIDLASWMTKWAFICVCLLVGVLILFVIFPFLNNVLDRIQAYVGPYGVVTLVSATLGPVVAAITGYTRPRRDDRAPGP